MPQECADCVLFFGCGAGEFVFRVVRALLFVTRMTMSKWIIPNGFIFWLFFPSLTEFQKFGFDGHIRIVSVCVRGWLFSFELLIFWLYNNIVLLDFCKVEWGGWSSGWKWRLLWHVSYIGCPSLPGAHLTRVGRVISRVHFNISYVTCLLNTERRRKVVCTTLVLFCFFFVFFCGFVDQRFCKRRPVWSAPLDISFWFFIAQIKSTI